MEVEEGGEEIRREGLVARITDTRTEDLEVVEVEEEVVEEVVVDLEVAAVEDQDMEEEVAVEVQHGVDQLAACVLQDLEGIMEDLLAVEPLTIGGETKRLQTFIPRSGFCCKFSVKFRTPRPLASVGRVIQP